MIDDKIKEYSGINGVSTGGEGYITGWLRVRYP